MAVSYIPSGRYDPAGKWGIPIGMATAVTAIGTLYNWLTFGPARNELYHDAALMFFGCLCMEIAGGLVMLFKMRNPDRAVAWAVFGALIGWLCAWIILKYIAAPEESFFAFLHERLNEGVRVIPRRVRRYSSYRASGFFLMLGWLVEAAVIIGFAALGACLQAKRPFSEKRGQWLRLRVKEPILTVYLPESYPPIDHKDIIRGLSEGNMAYLKQFTLWKPPRLSLFKRVPSLKITIMTDDRTPGGFLSLYFDDGEDRSSLMTNAYISNKSIKVIFSYFSKSRHSRCLH